MHIVGCTILDCDNVGLLIRDSRAVEYSTVFIDDRRGGPKALRIKAVDAAGNVINQIQ